MKKIPKRLRTQDRVCKKFQLLGVSRKRTEGSFKNTFLPKLLGHMLLRVGYKLLFPNLLCAPVLSHVVQAVLNCLCSWG